MEIGKVIVGQKTMVERLLVGLLSNGHILLEGVPGLAKTLDREDPRGHHPGEIPADPVHARIFCPPTSSAR